jgi:hypothetical protein
MSTQNRNVYQIPKLSVSAPNNSCVALETESRLHTLRFITS